MPDSIYQIASGDARALARAATAIENHTPEGAALLRDLAMRPKHAVVAGITGPPGAGKSTLVDALIRTIRREGKTVGVLAVDPTSRVSGGAILGDRIRMQDHHGDPGVFIRSLATRGASGGLARSTADLALLLNGAGNDYVLIETLGVGQDEVEIARVADITVLVLVPGMGDDVQAIKAGIMEIADIFVINKSDHPGADRVEQEIQSVLTLGPRPDGVTPPVIKTVATDSSGVEQLLRAIDQCATHSTGTKSKIPGPESGFFIDHLGIAVKSIEAALGFYADQLGMQVASRETVPNEKVHVAMLAAGGPRIELLEPVDPDSVIGRFLAKRGEGLHHVALRVPNLNTAVERLRHAGVRLLHEPQTGAGGHHFVFVHPSSTAGVLLELIEDR